MEGFAVLDQGDLVPIAVVVAIMLVIVLGAWVFGRQRNRTRGLSFQEAGGKNRKERGATAPQGASLYAVAGPLQGKRFTLSADGTYIGRRAENQIRVDTPLVSRSHTMILYESGVWRIVDQDSTNGTWVNGRRVAEHSLNVDDRVQVGPCVFVFQLMGGERTPTPRPLVARQAPSMPSVSTVGRIHDLSDYDMTEIGRGGEGVVYRGVSRLDDSVVAIKILESQDPYLAQKFKQAGEVGLLLRHPHIVATYHFGNQGETYYIIMEYAAGASLRHRLQPGVPLPLAEAIRILGQTCDALEFAHRHNVVHRDIKPANILFDGAGQVKLSDLGIAKLMTAPTITQAGLILGTPEYISYEQARGRTVVPQSDIYSLGVVAYQLFTGSLPFYSEGPDIWKTLDQHLKERPRPPRQINPAIPSQIEKAILKTLEKDASKRFRTCEEFAHALGYTLPMHMGPIEKVKGVLRSSASDARLVIHGTDTVIPIQGPELLVTRALLGGHSSVSREHARIAVKADQYWLRDEGSTNGTYCNRQRVFDWVLLHSNDTVTFGKIGTHFVIGDSPSKAPGNVGGKTRLLSG